MLRTGLDTGSHSRAKVVTLGAPILCYNPSGPCVAVRVQSTPPQHCFHTAVALGAQTKRPPKISPRRPSRKRLRHSARSLADPNCLRRPQYPEPARRATSLSGARNSRATEVTTRRDNHGPHPCIEMYVAKSHWINPGDAVHCRRVKQEKAHGSLHHDAARQSILAGGAVR